MKTSVLDVGISLQLFFNSFVRIKLIYSRIIQKFISSLLLVVFTLAVVPKAVFHDAFADHIDTPSCNDPIKNTTHLHKENKDCKFNLLVGNVPFLSQEIILNTGIITDLTHLYFGYFSSYPTLATIVKESRGPPEV